MEIPRPSPTSNHRNSMEIRSFLPQKATPKTAGCPQRVYRCHGCHWWPHERGRSRVDGPARENWPCWLSFMTSWHHDFAQAPFLLISGKKMKSNLSARLGFTRQEPSEHVPAQGPGISDHGTGNYLSFRAKWPSEFLEIWPKSSWQ